ncbi:VOC family protein [Streptomyces platensis]|uniref:VOC family protein n=1 Tax=Streptomyces platensis TaxID=58346 RepID=UPI001F28321D|nr:hypothetical protein [Streptomyces platensis]
MRRRRSAKLPGVSTCRRPAARTGVAGTHVYAWLDVGGVEFGFHMLDEQRNHRGGSPVPYWSVDDIESALTKLLAEGCTQHRDPLDIGDGTNRQIAQVVDPFGNIIGIDGP